MSKVSINLDVDLPEGSCVNDITIAGDAIKADNGCSPCSPCKPSDPPKPAPTPAPAPKPEPAPAPVGTVISNSAALAEMLAGNTDGGIFLLEPGDYGALSISNKDYKNPLVLKSIDGGVIFDSLRLSKVSKLTVQGCVLDYVFKEGDKNWSQPVLATDCDSISLIGNVMDGDVAEGVSDVDDGFGSGYGMRFHRCKNISVANNEIHTWMRAGVFQDVEGLTVHGNRVHRIRSDGFNFVHVSKTDIRYNHFYDFIGSLESKDHRDMIQFWTTGQTEPTIDVVIADNFFNVGMGTETQSIFIRNEAVDHHGAGKEMYYRNLLIENNVIHNNHAHGITVGECIGLVIRDNTLLPNRETVPSDELVWVPTINLSDKGKSEEVEVSNNIITRSGQTIGIGWDHPTADFANNESLDYDKDSDKYVGNYVKSPETGKAAKLADFLPLKGVGADLPSLTA